MEEQRRMSASAVSVLKGYIFDFYLVLRQLWITELLDYYLNL